MLVGQVGDISHEVGLVYSVRNLCNNDLVVGLATLDLCLGTHHDTATTCLVGILYSLKTIDICSCWEVGTWDILHQSVSVDVWIVDISAATVDNLTQIVGRHIGGHTYSDTITSVNQQVRNLGWHNCWLNERVVEVVGHVDSLLLEVVHDVLTHL